MSAEKSVQQHVLKQAAGRHFSSTRVRQSDCLQLFASGGRGDTFGRGWLRALPFVTCAGLAIALSILGGAGVFSRRGDCGGGDVTSALACWALSIRAAE